MACVLCSCSDYMPPIASHLDVLVLSPGTVLLSPPTESPDSGGASDGRNPAYTTEKVITVHLTRTSQDEVRLASSEGVHADVCIGSCKHPGSAESVSIPSLAALTQWLRLDEVQGDPASCQKRSDAVMHCIFSPDGLANFKAVALAPYLGSGGIPIVVAPEVGGTPPPQNARATVWIGTPLPDNAVMEFDTDSTIIPAKQAILACGAQEEPVGCHGDTQSRHTPMVLKLVRREGNDGASARNATVPGAFVDTTIKIFRDVGDDKAAQGGTARLSKDDPTCAQAKPFNSIDITIDGATGVSPSFFVCADIAYGKYGISATAVGGYAESVQTATASVIAAPQPARVASVEGFARSSDVSGQYDVDVVLSVTDCAGEPVGTLDVIADVYDVGGSEQTATTSAGGEATLRFTGLPIDVEADIPGSSIIFLKVRLPGTDSTCEHILPVHLQFL
ncbi:hypothetical protein WME76_12300 [Sorangium sp. So ce119]|uniref:hypothetical protein n=1 Tax=Sorangium sp. So ce119 TaxID=3133279 RepID=UPI003F609A6A